MCMNVDSYISNSLHMPTSEQKNGVNGISEPSQAKMCLPNTFNTAAVPSWRLPKSRANVKRYDGIR